MTPTDNGDYIVAITGTGNYTGTITVGFSIADTAVNTFAFVTYGDEFFYSGTMITGLADGVTSTDIVVPEKLAGHYVSSVNLQYCGLTSLDVHACGANLKFLACSGNKLKALDVSDNTALSSFACSNNLLTSLDIRKNTPLDQFACSSNKLVELDVSNNTVLRYLVYDRNRLASLDVSKNVALTDLDCSGNQLGSIDVGSNASLANLDCSGNQLASLDISSNASLVNLDCSGNQLPSLDISANLALEALDCSCNRLTSLDISRNASLTTLYCDCNRIADTSALEAWLASNSGQVLPQNRGKLLRLAGADRYATMSAILKMGFATGQNNCAILATGANYPDALAASGLAGVLEDAPVVLIDGSLGSAEGTEALAQLQRMGVKAVAVVGGENAVSAGIYDSLEDDGYEMERISGATRVETALQIYGYGKEWGSGWGGTVIVATSAGFADALSVSPLSYAARFPIILTDDEGNLTAAAKAAIEEGGFEHAIVVGGTAAVSEETESWLDGVVRLAGADRYATSAAIADFSSGQGAYAGYPAAFGYAALSYARPGVATGAGFPDALSGAAVCGGNGGVLLLATDGDTTCLGKLAANKAGVRCAYAFGGDKAISPSLYARLGAALS